MGENRFPLILQTLEKDVLSGSIICLQEVSITWVGKIHAFFAQHNYHYINTLYGSKFSGYMGVGLAFPRSNFRLVVCEITRIADNKPWPRPQWKPPQESTPAPPTSTLISDVRSYISGYLRNVLDPLFVTGRRLSALLTTAEKKRGKEEKESSAPQAREDEDEGPPLGKRVAETAMKRYNQAILVRLSPRGDSDDDDDAAAPDLCVATYHIPCTVNLKPVMTVHAALLLQKAQKFANGDPLVVCGDFNSLPGSGAYQLVTTGKIEEGHPDACPPLPYGDAWDCKDNLKPMASAYATAYGEEPKLTNKSVRKFEWPGSELNAFSGTLDYLFYTPDTLEVSDALPVPDAHQQLDFSDEVKSFPTATLPSDHVKIAATFQMKKRVRGETKDGGNKRQRT